MGATPSYDEAAIRAALTKAWSLETAKQWSPDNPANGQCNVTAAVIHDLYGLAILRTWVPGFWHYYNSVDGERVDFTDSQFYAPGARFAPPSAYADEPTTRAEAMSGIPEREHQALRTALLEQLGA